MPSDQRKKTHFFMSVVPLKSHNTPSDFYSAETQLNLKLTFLCHLRAHCVNINVWKYSIYKQLAISPATHIPNADRKEASQKPAEDRNSTLLTFTSLWDQIPAPLCMPLPGHFSWDVFSETKLKSKCLRGHQHKKAAFACSGCETMCRQGWRAAWG